MADRRPPTREDTAVVGNRIIAQVIDWIVILAILLVFSFVGGIVGQVAPASRGIVASLTGLLGILAMFGYTFLLEGYWDGKTLGKFLLNIKVVREDGSPCTPGASFVRNVPAFVWFTVFTYLVGFASMAATDRRQRLFDRLAGTVVVADRP
ncbi:MAG: RDD family protein [Halanaeroarchaeum sp.]